MAGYRAWQKLDRQVRKGEKGIKILAPLMRRVEREGDDGEGSTQLCGFRVVSVFDLSQTEGEPLPTVEVPLLDGEEGAELYSRLARFARAKFKLVDHEPIENDAAGYWKPSTKEIHVDGTLSQLQRVKTLAHELGHALAGHGLPGDRTDVRESETIAESVAFLVCDAFGLDTSERSFPYVATFAQNSKTFARLLGEVERVSKAILCVVTEKRAE